MCFSLYPSLLLSGILISLLLPVAQILLWLLYFKVGHPWSRILNAHVSVFSFKWKSKSKHDEHEMTKIG
jgi:hypothetical protein